MYLQGIKTIHFVHDIPTDLRSMGSATPNTACARRQRSATPTRSATPAARPVSATRAESSSKPTVTVTQDESVQQTPEPSTGMTPQDAARAGYIPPQQADVDPAPRN